MRKIMDIYDEYRIMPNLREHMFRVAAVATLICDNFEVPLPKQEIITASLFHDMGNILKTDFASPLFPKEFYDPEGVEYWQKVKDEYQEKYQGDEHVATMKIMQEVGLYPKIIDMVNHVGFKNCARNVEEECFENKICNYSDLRAGPFGILSLMGRLEEGNQRYAGKKHAIASEDYDHLANSIQTVEKQIFSKCRIKPEDITDETIAPIVEELRNYVIE